MHDLLLISFIFAPIVLPMIAARDQSPLRGLRKAILWWLLFNGAFLLAYLVIYPRLG